MSNRGLRWIRSLTPLALGLAGCVSQSYGASSRYPSPEPEPPALAAPVKLVSAHFVAFGVEPPPGSASQPRLADGGEASHDRVLLVFAEELDPLTLSPRSFAILRADGERVRPIRAFLGPADEGDENRSVTLLGHFAAEGSGTEASPPIAVHVIGPLYAESGATLEGLDADVTGPNEPDRPVVVERLAASPTRCPGAAQVIRATWTDALAEVGPADLPTIDLRLEDGRVIHPIEFDDQASREGQAAREGEPSSGPADDNVLDLCLDVPDRVVHLHVGAGSFRDLAGHPTAAADVVLP